MSLNGRASGAGMLPCLPWRLTLQSRPQFPVDLRLPRLTKYILLVVYPKFRFICHSSGLAPVRVKALCLLCASGPLSCRSLSPGLGGFCTPWEKWERSGEGPELGSLSQLTQQGLLTGQARESGELLTHGKHIDCNATYSGCCLAEAQF